ncbi:Butyrophilin-like protein 2, partial [Anabarilius grahami]
GDDVVLSCHLNPAISAASMEIMWWNKANLVCHYKDGQMTMSKDFEGRVSLSLEDLQNGNVFLTLRDVRRSHMGHYICEVIHEWRAIKEYFFLYTNCLSEDFSLVIPVFAAPGSDVILPVHLSPETSGVSMTVRWFRETELIYQYMNGQEKTNDNYEKRLSLSIQELERGNLSLTLRNFQPSDSGKYTCRVIHDGCLQTVHLQVRVAGESRGQHTTDGNTDTEQDLLTLETQDLPTELPSAMSSSRARTQGQENPRATMQTQERRHTEQERTSQTGTEDISLVVPNGIVSADPGSDVILPVHLSPETSAVSMTVRWFRETELIYQYKNRQEKTNDNYEKRVSLSIQELERGNLSLTLRNFEPSDSGKYTCKVFHDGCLQTGIVQLQEIQKCDEARLRNLHTVLRQVRDDILQEKVQLLTRSLGLLQETLNQGSAFGKSERQ